MKFKTLDGFIEVDENELNKEDIQYIPETGCRGKKFRVDEFDLFHKYSGRNGEWRLSIYESLSGIHKLHKFLPRIYQRVGTQETTLTEDLSHGGSHVFIDDIITDDIQYNQIFSAFDKYLRITTINSKNENDIYNKYKTEVLDYFLENEKFMKTTIAELSEIFYEEYIYATFDAFMRNFPLDLSFEPKLYMHDLEGVSIKDSVSETKAGMERYTIDGRIDIFKYRRKLGSMINHFLCEIKMKHSGPSSFDYDVIHNGIWIKAIDDKWLTRDMSKKEILGR